MNYLIIHTQRGARNEGLMYTYNIVFILRDCMAVQDLD